MTEPLAVSINVTTKVTDTYVMHVLELVESVITVTLGKDIGALGRLELMATLGQLLPLMDAVWREEPADGDTVILDLRRGDP